MQLSSIAAVFALLGVSQAWDINFVAQRNGKVKRVMANGTKRGNCINLRSDYDWPTTSILFHPQTAGWPDANSYAAYSKADCKGSAYYGVEGQQNPNKRFLSYRVK